MSRRRFFSFGGHFSQLATQFARGFVDFDGLQLVALMVQVRLPFTLKALSIEVNRSPFCRRPRRGPCFVLVQLWSDPNTVWKSWQRGERP